MRDARRIYSRRRPLAAVRRQGRRRQVHLRRRDGARPRQSRSRRRVLLLSMDPAHSLGDVFGAALGDRPAAVPGGPPNLHVREIDAAAEMDAVPREVCRGGGRCVREHCAIGGRRPGGVPRADRPRAAGDRRSDRRRGRGRSAHRVEEALRRHRHRHRPDRACAAAAADAGGAARLDAGADGDPAEVPRGRRRRNARGAAGAALEAAAGTSGDPEPIRRRRGSSSSRAPRRFRPRSRRELHRVAAIARHRRAGGDRERAGRGIVRALPRGVARAGRRRSRGSAAGAAPGAVTLSSRRPPKCRRRTAPPRWRRGDSAGGESPDGKGHHGRLPLLRRPRRAQAAAGARARGTARRDPARRRTGCPASLWLVTADVPLDTYGPAQLEPRLRDLEWVSSIAVAHEAVVEHFSRAKASVVVPTTLFTMFSSMDKAMADVAAQASDDRAGHAPHRRQRGVGHPDHAASAGGARGRPSPRARLPARRF